MVCSRCNKKQCRGFPGEGWKERTQHAEVKQTVRQVAGFAITQSSRKQSCVKYNSVLQACIVGAVKTTEFQGQAL